MQITPNPKNSLMKEYRHDQLVHLLPLYIVRNQKVEMVKTVGICNHSCKVHNCWLFQLLRPSLLLLVGKQATVQRKGATGFIMKAMGHYGRM